MNAEEIKKHFVAGQTPRKLRKKEKDLLISKIKYPFPGTQDIVDIIDGRLALICEIFLQDVQIYPCFIPVFIDNIHKTFLLSLSDPGTPVGPHTADSISQQATQAMLNTFHQAGTSKPGGSQGIKENIRISAKREQVYSTINFRNKRLTFDQVLDLKNELLGINIKNLTLDIKTMYIDIDQNAKLPYPRSLEECWNLIEEEKYWWYSRCHHDKVLTSYIEIKNGKEKEVTERLAIRMKLDVNKLVELKLTTCDIANEISERMFAIAKAKTKDKKEIDLNYKYVCFPSPTIFGIIDCFLISTKGPDMADYLRDYFLQQSISKEDFKDIYVAGIQGIENFYPVAKNVTSCIRSVEPAYEIVTNKNGVKEQVPKGTWVYLKSMRFKPVPIQRFISLCNSCGIECVEDPEALPFANLEFKAHKINLERRTKVVIEVCTQDRDELHRQFRKYPYFLLQNEYGYYFAKMNKPDEDYEQKKYDRFFPESVGIEVNYLKKNGTLKSGYIVRKYIDGNFDYSYEEKEPELVLDFEPINFETLTKLEEFFSDKDQVSQCFKDAKALCIKVGETYLVQEFITNFKEKIFEEVSIVEVENNKVIYFISNKPIGDCRSKEIIEVKNLNEIEKMIKNTDMMQEIFTGMLSPIQHVILAYSISGTIVEKYLIAYKYKKFSITLEINTKAINDPKTFHTLNSIIISKYSCKNQKIPLDKPKIIQYVATSEYEEQKLRKAILLKTFLPFRKISPQNFSFDETKDKETQYNEYIKQFSKTKPVDKLIQFLDQNCPKEEKEYVYAETKGSSLAKICIHPAVDASKTYSNLFTEILEFYGIEALRNLIEFDLNNVITMSDYIDPIYVKHAADVLTAKGKNPFTAKGISSQGTGPLSIITFNKVEENLRIFSQGGKKFSVNSTSTTILIGVEAPLGTGFASVVPIMEKLRNKEILENDPEFFKRIENISDDEKIQNFNLDRGKFPKNSKIVDKYQKKGIEHYIPIKIYKFKHDKMKKCEADFGKFSLIFRNVKINIEKIDIDKHREGKIL